MQSNNPVFRNAEGFNGQRTYAGNGQAHAGYGQQPGYGQAQGYPQQPGYSDPSTWGTGTPTQPGLDQGRMTIDSVVQKTGISLVVVIATAIATWLWTGDLSAESANRLYLAMVVGGGIAFVLSMVNSFKRVINPGLVLAFAAAEGVALGAFSKFIDATYVSGSGSLADSLVFQAVIGTFAAFAGTLAAYKFFDIKVGQKFRTFTIAAMFGMIGLGLMEMVLGFFGNQVGFFTFGSLGLVFAIAGLVLGVFMLIMDFDFVEQGIAAGLPEQESWRAAFAITVSLVWIYTNLLRILAILRGE